MGLGFADEHRLGFVDERGWVVDHENSFLLE